MFLEYTVTDAKAKFSEVISHVVKGDRVIVTKNGIPVAEIIEYEQKKDASKRLGFAKGEVHIPDDFNSPGGWGEETARALGIIE